MKTLKVSNAESQTWNNASVLGEMHLESLTEVAAQCAKNDYKEEGLTLISGTNVYRGVKLHCIDGLRLTSTTMIVSAKFVLTIGETDYYLDLEMGLDDVPETVSVVVMHH